MSAAVDSLALPVLKLAEPVHQVCDGSKCATCPLHKTLCHGCGINPEKTCGEQHTCNTECNECHGAFTAKLMTGVCCKSPLAPFAIRQIQTWPSLTYVKHKALDFPDERIPVLLDRHHKTLAPVNAVGIHRVYSGKGWKSRDIKDYLQLDKKTKLVLLTVMRDNFLERFMDMKWYDTVQDVGFDVWQPLMFSTFMDESNMQKIYSYWRILRNLQDSGGHMVPFLWGVYPRLKVEDMVLPAIKSVPNIFINASHGSEQKEFQTRIFLQVKKWGAIFGPKVTWLVQGMTARYKRMQFRSLLPKGTSCYFFITPKTGARRTEDQYGWLDEKSTK